MKVKNRIAVLAGNLKEFNYFLEEQKEFMLSASKIGQSASIADRKEYFYLSSANQLRGLRDYILITYGTWFNRPNREIDAIREIHFINQERGQQ